MNTQFNNTVLTYRGIPYHYSPRAIATLPTQTTARYRGLTYQVRKPLYACRLPKTRLTYRGVAYGAQISTNNQQPLVPAYTFADMAAK